MTSGRYQGSPCTPFRSGFRCVSTSSDLIRFLVGVAPTNRYHIDLSGQSVRNDGVILLVDGLVLFGCHSVYINLVDTSATEEGGARRRICRSIWI